MAVHNAHVHNAQAGMPRHAPARTAPTAAGRVRLVSNSPRAHFADVRPRLRAGSPASSTVKTSGTAGVRCLPVTA